jgi:ABC-type lipoprotein release transport system permease subunit
MQYVSSQFRFRRGRTLALGIAILVSAVSFTLLSSAAKTSALRVQGSVRSNYRAAYDILVRPSRAATKLEREQRLVRPNYLSGIFGGITFRQYEQIKRIPGVEVAAPIANIGYVLPLALYPVSIKDLVSAGPEQLYALSGSFTAQRGLSHYPLSFRGAFVYYTTRERFVQAGQLSRVLPGPGPVIGRLRPTCSLGPQTSLEAQGAFDRLGYTLSCYSRRSPGEGYDSAFYQGYWGIKRGFVGTAFSASFPVLISAVDPVQEARLVGLNQAVVWGRYLSENDRPALRQAGGSLRVVSVPVLAATRTFVDESLVVRVRRLRVPRGVSVLSKLSSRLPSQTDIGFGTRTLGFLKGLNGPTVATRRYPLALIWSHLLSQLLKPHGAIFDKYWLSGPVTYRRAGTDLLAPVPVKNPASIWHSNYYASGFEPAPQDNRDLQFRHLSPPYLGNNMIAGGTTLGTPTLRVVGRYDPNRLRGFSRLSRVPLETYYPPELAAADARSARLLHGQPLRPTQNVGDYIQKPPLLLTTLEGLKPFLNTQHFQGPARKAPISVIRVRVEGVKGPDALSQLRVRTVATAIHDDTGLDVDITAGSSPHPLLVRLPRGRFGRPPLLLREGWSKKGVSVSFLKALDRKDAALFGLILLIGGLFLGNGAFAAARTRRGEIGTLLTLGWPRAAIFGVVLAELALVALLAGVVGMAVALTIVSAFSLHVTLLQTLLVIPISVGLALLAGFVPALLAASGAPLDALRPLVAGRTRGRNVRRLTSLAFVNLRRLPIRTLLGTCGLFVGVAALTILLAIQHAFHGTLIGTALGNAVAVQVRSADYVAVALTIALATLSVADVLYLNLRERAAEFVTLRTVGWDEGQLVRLVLLEASGLGLVGSIGGALVGFAVGAAVLHVPIGPLAAAAAVTAVGGLMTALVASLIPLSQLARLTAPQVLAAE